MAPRVPADLTRTSAGGVGGTPNPEQQPDAADSIPFIMPAGESADEATVLQVSTTVLEVLACQNAGDPLRTSALYTESFQRRLSQNPVYPWRLDPLSPGSTPLPETGRHALLSVVHIRAFDDGRVGALIHTNSPRDPRPEEVTFITFVQKDGRWLIEAIAQERAGTQPLTALATLKDAAGSTVGTATLTQEFGGWVTVSVTLDGAPPGGHAVHVHDTGTCDSGEDEPFTSAGDHFNPNGAMHPNHAGDLGNMGTDTDGRGEHWTGSDRFTLSQGPTSLMDTDGSALIIHAGMDLEMSEPEGNSGSRIACGVITMADLGAPVSDGGANLTMLALGGLVLGSGGLLAMQGWRAHRRRAARQQRRRHASSRRSGRDRTHQGDGTHLARTIGRQLTIFISPSGLTLAEMVESRAHARKRRAPQRARGRTVVSLAQPLRKVTMVVVQRSAHSVPLSVTPTRLSAG
ncbi:MAG: superoxide dismutase family protein [Chloroflexia bacterium]|nr:superoxide dismutase family protein [Chloroflexia bacterium]